MDEVSAIISRTIDIENGGYYPPVIQRKKNRLNAGGKGERKTPSRCPE
jgi:hypothetical protein